MEKAQNLPTELMAHVLRMTQYSKYFFKKKKACTTCVVVLDATLPFICPCFSSNICLCNVDCILC
jgi:hypothetical protein